MHSLTFQALAQLLEDIEEARIAERILLLNATDEASTDAHVANLTALHRDERALDKFITENRYL